MSQTSLLSIEQQALQLNPDEQLVLVEKLARNLRGKGYKKAPKKMYGAWKEYFPEDFDVENALKEIRSEWKKDFEDV